MILPSDLFVIPQPEFRSDGRIRLGPVSDSSTWEEPKSWKQYSGWRSTNRTESLSNSYEKRICPWAAQDIFLGELIVHIILLMDH